MKRFVQFILIIPLLPLLGIFGLLRFFFVDFLGYIRTINRNFSTLKHGISASGRIIFISQTGEKDANNLVYRVQISYETVEGETVIADAVNAINPIDISHFQPGNTVPIKYNPKEKDQIAINYH
ncbi:hypothetical protein PMPD1_0840 [Paramixta manurensis]|uniref:DUF3592 domain-containing protein n=1 Tax=Paramixta manurensis TaxID=2740817 RepID=A0A6M8UAB2_9GAMM|nr:hypothetical protein PMPD1_0840 [Erwiniaceae bacterium PD-1]